MQQMKQYLSVAVCGFFTLLAASASAQTVVLSENFDYPDNALDTANPLWINHSGASNPIMVGAQAAIVKESAAGYDYHRLFDGAATFSSGIVTANFDIVVTAPGAMTGTDFEYFAHFWQSTAATSFRSRTDIVGPGTAGGDYSIGIATQSSTAEVTLGDLVGFTFGDLVPVTITFDISAGTSSLTAGGQTVNTLVVSLAQNIDGFAFRQDTSSSLETIIVDNLVVTYTPVPEPSTFALIGGLIALGVLVVRRRR